LAHVGSWWTLIVLQFGLLLALLVLRRWRHLIVWLVVWNVIMYLVGVLNMVARRLRPFGVDLRISWGGWAMPSMEVTHLTLILVGVLYTLVAEGRWRNRGKWVTAGLVPLVAVARIALGTEAPTDVLLTVGIAVSIPLLAFRRFTPSEVFPIVYRRAAARTWTWAASGSSDPAWPGGPARPSRPADQALRTGRLGRLHTAAHHRQGRPAQAAVRQAVRAQPPARRPLVQARPRAAVRPAQDEKPFNTVRRLVQQEDYALSLMQRAGLPSSIPYGFVELTPDREYLLVTEFFDGAVELGEPTVDEQVIDDGLSIVRRLWDAGLAHRDVHPANPLVRDGQTLLIAVAFVEARPSPWRQAVDLANMMLCLALRSRPEQVYQRALRQFSVEEISEGFAAARGLALPSQLRRMLRTQGRDLHAEFVKLLPAPPQPIRIQRWSLRRVGLWAAIVTMLVLVALNPTVIFDNRMAVRTSLGIHSLNCGQLEPLWLMAQSVPSASLVPCVPSQVPGWKVADVAVNNGRSVIALDHDRAGKRAAVVRLAAGCDTAGTIETPSPTPLVQRYQRIDSATDAFGATWYDRFPGGCVTYRLHSTSDLEGSFAIELPGLLGFTSRDTLHQELSQRSGGRLQLDAAQS
jgi:tRNA A-37 threonylcarbamoyl transferase component Bud32